MAKTVKKKNRKMRRQIRKTVGALLMISAIVVGTLPVQDVQANVTDNTQMIQVVNYTSAAMSAYEQINSQDAPSQWQSKVPYVDSNATIYTTGTSGNVNFQFAFVKPSATAGDEVAVILGATINNLPNNALTIPEEVDAYKKYTANTTNSGYCAVNRSDQFLYYLTSEQKKNSDNELLFKVSGYTPNSGATEVAPSHVENYTDTTDPAKTITVKEFMSLQSDGTTYKYVIQKKWTETVSGVDEEKTDEVSYDTIAIMVDTMNICYYENQDPWVNLPDTELYYWNGAGAVDLTDITNFAKAATADKQRIHNAKVQYIGRQYLNGVSGEWSIAGIVDPKTNPDKGVFAGKGQIVNLTIADNLLGVGDCAFYGCSGINSVTLGNGLSTIGNGAFANCVNMTECNMQLNSEIAAIGKDAFANCRALKNFTVPLGVYAIGDYCFQGCSALESIELCGNGSNVQLTAIGYRAFENCSNLSSVTFPSSFEQNWNGIDTDKKGVIPINYFLGCTNLQYIKIQNTTLDIIDGDTISGYDKSVTHVGQNCDINNFLALAPESFYFEGPDTLGSNLSPIHKTAQIHSASFKYLNEDKYERVIQCKETPSHLNTFIVNSSNELMEMIIADGCTEIEIPEQIGTFGVETLSSTSFYGNCTLKKVTIPSSVKLIQSGAFKGCHNLQHVIFTQPENANLVIESGAFATQAVDYHTTNCPTSALATSPSLTFTGTVGDTSPTFLYAMNPDNKINVGTQPATYITFYSGWPTNQTIIYNQDTDKNELIDYPKYDELVKYTKDPNTTTGIYFPYITDDYVTAAQNAVTAYEAWDKQSQTGRPTDDQMAIINSALNIVMPAGIESIATAIFSGLDTDGKTLAGGTLNDRVETITCNTVEEIEPYTFAGCTKLNGFWMNGGNSIDDYAFKGDSALVNVGIGDSISSLGIRPFAGCGNLEGVNFATNPNFTCEEAVIFTTAGGAKTGIVECLESRGALTNVGNTQVGPDELAGITTIAPEAFKDCDDIVAVDLSSSAAEAIPEQCFASTDRLSTVILPDSTVDSIDKGAFWNSTVANVRIPDKTTLIELQAFADVKTDAVTGEILLDSSGNPTIEHETTGHKTITFNCPDDSFANTYADKYYYINTKSYTYYTVLFMDKVDMSILKKQTVLMGEAATPPDVLPVHEGMTFTGWSSDGYKKVIADGTYYAEYSSSTHTVKFLDWDGTELCAAQTVADGKSATPPAEPTRTGYTFTGWSADYHDVTKDLIIIAIYKDNSGDTSRHTVIFYSYDGKTAISTQKVDDGGSAVAPMPPTRSGYTFVGWIGSYTNVTKDQVVVASYEKNSDPSPTSNPSKTATPTPTSSGGSTDNVKKYTVSVSGGSGTGSYPAGAVVPINAYDMGTGQNFDKWTSSTAGVGFANPNATSTTFTMPAANVAVSATYKTGSSSNATNTNSGGSSNSGGSGSSSNNNGNNAGTSVEVTKPGIPSTNLAGATVSGSTDNFVVKVTEDSNATDAAIAALQGKYGDISKIKYCAMDISLYDSTGRTKIADTSGMAVNLTLPLPSELVQYAGNNRVASVANGILEDIPSQNNTVDNTACVNFTAPHLSPYVIYVDTANLVEGTVDATPKTGDPIHPKWFLAMGLACISLILFFKRDRIQINTKTA